MKLAFWVALVFIAITLSTCPVYGDDMTSRIEYPEYWYQQGVSEYLLHHYDRALFLLDAALAQDPNLADAWYWRGVTLATMGNTSGSQESIVRAKELNPTIDDPYRRRVGSLADLAITPVPTPRETYDEQPQMVETNIDLSKQPDPTGPDIVISSFEPTVREGYSQLEVKATVENRGYQPSTDFFLTFYESDDPVISKADDTAIGYYLIPNLKPGTSKNLTGYFPMEQMTPGTFYIGVIADQANEIMEVSEENNKMVTPTKITIPNVKGSSFQPAASAVPFVVEGNETTSRFTPSQPDLVITSVTSPATAVQGGTIAVQTTVQNQGSSPAGPFRISLYLSPDATVSDQDRELGYGDVSDLGAGMLREGSASAKIPADLEPGTYYVGVMVDSKRSVSEENEINNVRFSDHPITITSLVSETPVPDEKLPDLEVKAIRSDTEGSPGNLMNVTTSVQNTGTATAGPFKVSLYLSKDSGLSDDDILIGMGEVSELPAGTQSDGKAPSPIPQNLTPGIYYFGILVDSTEVVAESDETNNVGFAQSPVTIR